MTRQSLLMAGVGIWVACALPGQSAEVWVSPSGKDDNSGTKDAPVATLACATALERQARAQDPKSLVTVWLAAGDYLVDEGWTLGAEDSGTADAPVIWRAVEKGKARLLGSRAIAPEMWKPVDDPDLLARLSPLAKGHIVQLDIAAAGLHPAQPFPDYSAEPPGSLVLFSGDESLPLSRWPNGPYGYTTIDHVLANGGPKGSADTTAVFVYRGEEPARWVKALDNGGVWIRGFWRVPWVADTLRVTAIDPTTKTITLGVTGPMGIAPNIPRLKTARALATAKKIGLQSICSRRSISRASGRSISSGTGFIFGRRREAR